ncbi:Fur-regulated basic protein FbpA [Bacillus cereus group sp. BfR-BA-01422]|uniref:Fur-regulated basic protein FbpA n=1 Tax=Bacillus cereus group sp. BfR-BA-01422 TaxID=2920339 RepID=UPI001F562FE4|nr:Fur-regulated basic protein FbpA [Bacillus cereus group sp. BfR-BA-01422]
MYPLLEEQGGLTNKRMLHDLLLKEIYIEALIRRNVFKTEDGRDLWQASNEELHEQLFDEEGN